MAKYFLNHSALVDIDADASQEGEADVLLGSVSVLERPQNVLSGHQVQQEQHSAARQVVFQFPVSVFSMTNSFFFALLESTGLERRTEKSRRGRARSP